MAIEEVAFYSVENNRPCKHGEITAIITSDMVKSKWCELVFYGLRLEQVHIHRKHHLYIELCNAYPQAIVSVGRNGVFLTQRELSFFYWVVKGDISRETFNVLKECWTEELYNKYVQAQKDKSVCQFYDDYLYTMDGLIHALGKDARKDANLIDTWVWGKGDKQYLFITQVESKRPIVDIAINSFVDIHSLFNIGISEKTQSEFTDESFIVEPRRNKNIPESVVQKKESVYNGN